MARTFEKEKSKQNIKNYVYKHYLDLGYRPIEAAAIVGNLDVESGFSEDVIDGRRRGDNGTAFGAAQWRGDRQTNLRKFTKTPNDLKSQLDFIHWELNNTHKGALASMRKANNVQEATTAFMNDFERPNKDPKINGIQRRVQSAGNMLGVDVSDFTYDGGNYSEGQDRANLDIDTSITMDSNRGYLESSTEEYKKPKEESEEVKQAKQEVAEKSFAEDFRNILGEQRAQQVVQQEPMEQFAPDDQLDPYNYIQLDPGYNFEEFQQGGRFSYKRNNQALETSKDNTYVARDRAALMKNVNLRNKTDQEIAEERRLRIQATADANKNQTLLGNKDWRKTLAAQTATTGDSMRASLEPNFFDDYINPAVMIGDMAANLGSAPMRAEEQDSYLPYATAVGMPLAVGAIAGIGSKTTGQFVNNVANPLAGTGDLVNNLGNKYLPNAYKLNPFAEKLKNADSSYRVAGLDAYEDFIKTGGVRSVTPEIPQEFAQLSLLERLQHTPRPTSFPSFQKGFADLGYLPKEGGVVFKTDVPTFKRGEINPVTGKKITGRHYAHRAIDTETGVTIGNLPASDVKVFSGKPDWLKGYKEIEAPKSSFKSEVDWGQWNEEILDNPKLLQEYSQIERAAKADGSWMKNADGTEFTGSPEQFIQTNSENFKKAFPDGYDITYRGMPEHSGYLNENKKFTGIFTGNRDLASGYGEDTIFKQTDAVNAEGVHELALRKTDNKIGINAYEDSWDDLKFVDRNENWLKSEIQSSEELLKGHILKGDKRGIEYMTKVVEEQKKNLQNYDSDIINSEALDKMKKYFASEEHAGKWNTVNTNNVAKYLENNNIDRIDIKNIHDGGFGDIIISNQVKGNYLKSLNGNNGMFDMNDMNAYKSFIPAALGVGAATQYEFNGGGVIKDNQGQRKYPNQITEIQGDTMATDGYGDIDLYVIPDVGQPRFIKANSGVHKFKGAKRFTEYPIKK